MVCCNAFTIACVHCYDIICTFWRFVPWSHKGKWEKNIYLLYICNVLWRLTLFLVWHIYDIPRLVGCNWVNCLLLLSFVVLGPGNYQLVQHSPIKFMLIVTLTDSIFINRNERLKPQQHNHITLFPVKISFPVIKYIKHNI